MENALQELGSGFKPAQPALCRQAKSIPVTQNIPSVIKVLPNVYQIYPRSGLGSTQGKKKRTLPVFVMQKMEVEWYRT